MAICPHLRPGAYRFQVIASNGDGNWTALASTARQACPLTDVSKPLGHVNPHVTATVYAHALPGKEERLVRAVRRGLPRLRFVNRGFTKTVFFKLVAMGRVNDSCSATSEIFSAVYAENEEHILRM
jgi:hypothetical protein